MTSVPNIPPYGPIYGTNGDDFLTIVFSIRDDTLIGGAGDDTIVTFRGDQAYGGSGDDLIKSHRQLDSDPICHLFGGTGDDTLVGGGPSFENGPYEITGQTELYGGSGNDKLVANTAEQRLFGGTGDDFLIGSYAGAHMHGGAGNDLLFSSLRKYDAFPTDPFVPVVGRDGNNWFYSYLDGGDGNDNIYCAPLSIDTIFFRTGGGTDVVNMFDTHYMAAADGFDGDIVNLRAFHLGMTAAEVIDTYATEVNGDTILRLAPDAVLVLKDVAAADLVDQILV